MDLKHETDLAALVVLHLQLTGWEVYQEVAARGSVADIVAVSGKLIWVIETKMTLSLAVIEQAYDWIGHAHFVSVAAPQVRRNAGGSHFAHRVLCDYGIGLFRVSSNGVQEALSPKLHRRISDKVRSRLCEQQKTYAPAGTKNGGHWTPFKQTVQNVTDYVRAHPGVQFNEMFSVISTHYRSPATARASLLHWIDHGVIKNVQIERVGKHIFLYPSQEQSCQPRL